MFHQHPLFPNCAVGLALINKIDLESVQRVGISKPTSLLSFNLHRGRHGTRSNTRVGLHPDGVNGVRGEITDGGQFVVVHHLETPRSNWLIRIGAVVYLVTLETNKLVS
jgi:hypothetical protein